MFSFAVLNKVFRSASEKPLSGIKQVVALLLLAGFISQLNGEFISAAISFIQKKAVEQVADNLNTENENGDDFSDVVSPKKSKWAKKTFPPKFPFDVSPAPIALNDNFGVDFYRPVLFNGFRIFHSFFLKTPRYIAFRSLIFYEL